MAVRPARRIRLQVAGRLRLGREYGAQIFAHEQAERAKIIAAHSVEMKRVMFPADLKRAFAEVLRKAKPCSRRKRRAPEPRQCSEVARRQSCLDEPAADAVALGCSKRRQHAGSRRARRFCPVEERQDRPGS